MPICIKVTHLLRGDGVAEDSKHLLKAKEQSVPVVQEPFIDEQKELYKQNEPKTSPKKPKPKVAPIPKSPTKKRKQRRDKDDPLSVFDFNSGRTSKNSY